jgi:hypothetical protein
MMNFKRPQGLGSLMNNKKKQLSGRTQQLLMGSLDTLNQMSGVGMGLTRGEGWVNRPVYWYDRVFHSYSWTQQSSTSLSAIGQSVAGMSAVGQSPAMGMSGGFGGASAMAPSFLPPLGGSIAPPLGGDLFSSAQGAQGNSLTPQKYGQNQSGNGQGQSKNGQNRSNNGQSQPNSRRTQNSNGS